jgi:hypothetical protein
MKSSELFFIYLYIYNYVNTHKCIFSKFTKKLNLNTNDFCMLLTINYFINLN